MSWQLQGCASRRTDNGYLAPILLLRPGLYPLSASVLMEVQIEHSPAGARHSFHRSLSHLYCACHSLDMSTRFEYSQAFVCAPFYGFLFVRKIIKDNLRKSMPFAYFFNSRLTIRLVVWIWIMHFQFPSASRREEDCFCPVGDIRWVIPALENKNDLAVTIFFRHRCDFS